VNEEPQKRRLAFPVEPAVGVGPEEGDVFALEGEALLLAVSAVDELAVGEAQLHGELESRVTVGGPESLRLQRKIDRNRAAQNDGMAIMSGARRQS
jgi:hypothetical protein